MDTINKQMNTLVDEQAHEIKELKKENEELKELVEDLHGRHMEDCVRDGKQDREITRLKEEIKNILFQLFGDEIGGLPPNTGERM